MSFGKTLINLRKSRNLTQEELAAKLYVTRQAVSRWERDEVVPGIDMLKLIAVTLDEPTCTCWTCPSTFAKAVA